MKRKTGRPKRGRSKRVKSKRGKSKRVRSKRVRSKRVKRVRSKRRTLKRKTKRIRKKWGSKRVTSKRDEGNKVLRYILSGGSDKPITMDDVDAVINDIYDDDDNDDKVLSAINKVRKENNLPVISQEQLNKIGEIIDSIPDAAKREDEEWKNNKSLGNSEERKTEYLKAKAELKEKQDTDGALDLSIIGDNPRRNIAALEYNFETEPINKTEYNWDFDCNESDMNRKKIS